MVTCVVAKDLCVRSRKRRPRVLSSSVREARDVLVVCGEEAKRGRTRFVMW